jgi:hypothetical protein
MTKSRARFLCAELRQHAAEFLKLAQSARGERRAYVLALAKVWT